MTEDAVDRLLAQWNREHPELDVSPMGIVGRMSRACAILERSITEVLGNHGLLPGEFDLLATLRRSGEPYQLTVGELLNSVMVTSGAVTNRLNRLVDKGLVTRETDPNHRRSVIVGLTDKGFDLVETALPDHLENERQHLDSLTERQQQQLADLLRRLLVGLDSR